MTTLEPGASEVFTHGLTPRPRATARWARGPAATMTEGFDVFVQLVIAAMTTSPSRRVELTPDAATDAGSWPMERREASRRVASVTRSWGREGPAREGSTVARSS